MSKVTSLIKDFINDESGLTAVEYAIAGGLVVGAMVGAFVTLGNNATGQITTLGCAAGGFTVAPADVAETSVGAGDAITAGDCV
jgi:pilus assembly protein Flp/PilA